MKYDLVIFDLDGTILNTIDDLADSCNYILQKNGFPLHSTEEIKLMVGNGIPKLIERALPEGVEETVYKKILQEYISWYNSHCTIKTGPYEGIIDCIKKMKSFGVKVAVNTNKVQKASEELCSKYFPDLFDYIAGNRPGIPVKPSPLGVQEIIRNLNKSAERTVFVGDSDVDILTAENAGLDVVSVAWGFRGESFLKSHHAHKIVFNCEELFCSIK